MNQSQYSTDGLHRCRQALFVLAVLFCGALHAQTIPTSVTLEVGDTYGFRFDTDFIRNVQAKSTAPAAVAAGGGVNQGRGAFKLVGVAVTKKPVLVNVSYSVLRFTMGIAPKGQVGQNAQRGPFPISVSVVEKKTDTRDLQLKPKQKKSVTFDGGIRLKLNDLKTTNRRVAAARRSNDRKIIVVAKDPGMARITGKVKLRDGRIVRTRDFVVNVTVISPKATANIKGALPVGGGLKQIPLKGTPPKQPLTPKTGLKGSSIEGSSKPVVGSLKKAPAKTVLGSE